MTAQTSTQPARPGARFAPSVVVIIATIAFVAGLALARVMLPGGVAEMAAPAQVAPAQMAPAQMAPALATAAPARAIHDAALPRSRDRSTVGTTTNGPATVAAPGSYGGSSVRQMR